MLFHVFADGRKKIIFEGFRSLLFIFSFFHIEQNNLGIRQIKWIYVSAFPRSYSWLYKFGILVRLAATHSHHVPQRKTWMFSVSLGGREESHARNFLPLGFSERWFWFLIPLWCEMRWNYNFFFLDRKSMIGWVCFCHCPIYIYFCRVVKFISNFFVWKVCVVGTRKVVIRRIVTFHQYIWINSPTREMDHLPELEWSQPNS